MADVDEDGKLDVLVLSHESTSIVWLRGQADSTLVAGAAIGTPVSNATAFVTCDANKDGHVDLVVSGDSLHLRLGDGHGTFTDGGLLFGSARCGGVATADTDGDGLPEVIAGCDDALAHELFAADFSGGDHLVDLFIDADTNVLLRNDTKTH